MFSRYELRTIDVPAARSFYTEAVGLDFGSGDAPLDVVPLPERARAMGAPAHWLGHVGVKDRDAAVRRFVELGAQQLGPAQAHFAAFRDPLGAVVAVTSRTEAPRSAPVGWHQLHTTDRDRAWSVYAELFGWSARELRDTTPEVGPQQTFAWDRSGPIVGAMANSARLPQTHTHWLFFFRVTDLDAVVEKIRTNGGEAFTTAELPSGARLVACHDPQGAAFGLWQSTSA